MQILTDQGREADVVDRELLGVGEDTSNLQQ